MEKETLTVIELIHYSSFKEKLKLTKELKGKVEIIDDKYVYVERIESNEITLYEL